MKRFYLTVVFFIFPSVIFSQGISIHSFQELPYDLDARVNYPRNDNLGIRCAIIKVVTDDSSCVFKSERSELISVLRKTGEYWVYISSGVMSLNIHNESDSIEFIFPEKIQPSIVYELRFNSGNLTGSEKVTSGIRILTEINSDPPGADLYLNDVYTGQTPVRSLLPEGNIVYRLEKAGFNTDAGVFNLNSSESFIRISIPLQEIGLLNPLITAGKFRSLLIRSQPEDSAQISIDGLVTEYVTPSTLDNISFDEHKITLRKNWFEPISKTVTNVLSDTPVDFRMLPAYGMLNITADDNCSIFIDSVYIGSGNWEGKLVPGWHLLVARREKYHDANEVFEIKRGINKIIRLDQSPMLGSLNLQTNILGAGIKINNIDYGNTPKLIDSIPVGQYEISLSHQGYVPVGKKVNIYDKDTLYLKETLFKGMEITLSSELPGIQISIDSTFIEKLPVTLTLNYGIHVIIFYYKDLFFTNEINVELGGNSNFHFTIDDIFKGKKDRTIYDFKAFEYAKAYYKRHPLALSYSYYDVNLKNPNFISSIKDGSISKTFGHSASASYYIFPFFAQLSFFSSGFFIRNTPPFNIDNTVYYRGAEISACVSPFSLFRNIYPFAGIGFQKSQLVTGKGKLTEMNKANINASLPLLKTGLQIKILKIILTGEYKFVRGLKDNSFNSDQFSIGVGYIL